MNSIPNQFPPPPRSRHSVIPSANAFAIPPLLYTIAPILHHSSVLILHYSIIPSLHHSITPIFCYSITPLLHYSNTYLLSNSNTPLFHYSTSKLPHHSLTPPPQSPDTTQTAAAHRPGSLATGLPAPVPLSPNATVPLCQAQSRWWGYRNGLP